MVLASDRAHAPRKTPGYSSLPVVQNTVGGKSAYTSAAYLRMARSTVGTEDEESFEIEVLRNVSQLQTSTCTLVTNCTADSISDLSLICRNRRKRAELTPMRGRGNGEQKNGCCHSTPLLGSASNNMPLKEYFSRLSLPVVGFTIYLHIYNRVLEFL